MMSEPDNRMREAFAYHLNHLDVCIDLVRKDPSNKAVEMLRDFALRMKKIGKRRGYEKLAEASGELDFASDETVIAGSQSLRSLLKRYAQSDGVAEMRLLVISPDPAILKAAQASTVDTQSEILHVESPAQAKKYLRTDGLCLIICDFSSAQLAEIDKFFDAAQATFTDAPPVIAMSSSGDSDAEARLWERGADACISSSINPDVFTKMLANRLQRIEADLSQRRWDSLSATPNRAAFIDELRRGHALSVQEQSPLAMAILDLDGFALIRKTHGHATANELLRHFSKLISGNLREYDYLARIREDRFGVLFPDARCEEAVNSLKRCQESLRNDDFKTANGSRITFTFSAGLAKVALVDAVSATFSSAYFHLEIAKSAGASAISTDHNAEDPSTGPAVSASADAGKTKRRILLIDDDVSTLAMMKKILMHAGYDVEVAETGQEGILRNKRTHPDLILCDVNMPNMNGFTVCARIRGRKVSRGDLDGRDVDPTTTVPILMLTADSSQDSVKLALSRGANGYLLKPVKPKELKERIEMVLAERDTLKKLAESRA